MLLQMYHGVKLTMSTENEVEIEIQNPEEYTSDDSLKVTENEDGTFTIEWDSNDPRYALFNGLNEEQMNDLLNQAIKEKLIAEGFNPDEVEEDE